MKRFGVRDRERGTGRVALGADGKHRCHRAGVDRLVEKRETGAQRVGVADGAASVPLYSGGDQTAVDVACDAVEIEVADGVGREMHAAVAAERRKLVVEASSGLLVRDNPVVVLLVLALIQPGRGEGAGKPGGAIRSGARGKTGRVGNLEVAAGGAAHECDAARGVQDQGDVCECLVLVR